MTGDVFFARLADAMDAPEFLQTAPYRFSGAEVRPGRAAGAIAADTAAVLDDVLGLDDAAVAALYDDGVVHGGKQ
jgi:CoA:oxalate CoA-transferase